MIQQVNDLGALEKIFSDAGSAKLVIIDYFSRKCGPCKVSFKFEQKNFKSIWTKIRLIWAKDSIQNSSGKPNRQAKGYWEIKLLDKA